MHHSARSHKQECRGNILIHIALVDDHDIFRAGVCKLLDMEPDIEVVGETGIGRDAITLFKKLKPDVALIDIDLPDIDGLDLCKRIISIAPEVRTVILTMYDSEEFASRALSFGAKGYIFKGMSPGLLPDAIRKVVSGGIFISPSLQDKMIVRQYTPVDDNPLKTLSDKELTVLKHLVRGMNTREISESIFLSESTVKYHKKHIFDKVGVHNIAELVRFAMKHGIIE